jgi:hypothetical protein
VARVISLKVAMRIDSGGVTGRLADSSSARVRSGMLASIQPCILGMPQLHRASVIITQ